MQEFRRNSGFGSSNQVAHRNQSLAGSRLAPVHMQRNNAHRAPHSHRKMLISGRDRLVSWEVCLDRLCEILSIEGDFQ